MSIPVSMKEVQEFDQREWILADMSDEDLRRFVRELGYDVDDELPPVQSVVYIGNHGGLKYFANGREIVVAFNEEPGSFERQFEEPFRRQVIQWLHENNIPWKFL